MSSMMSSFCQQQQQQQQFLCHGHQQISTIAAPDPYSYASSSSSSSSTSSESSKRSSSPSPSPSLRWTTGSCCIPKESETNPRGEDAHFVCSEKQTIGVADGVGGWVKYGVDAGEYSRQLMSNSLLALKQEPYYSRVDPGRVLNLAYSNTKTQGSSTACIITLSGQSLQAVNIGDSGFRVLRNGKCIYRSPMQQRKFNCPYQLGLTKDNPTCAQELEVKMEDGDVVVAGSDGLFDNMFDSEIEHEVKRGIVQGTEAQEISYRLAELALYNSFDRFTSSPFSLQASTARVKHRGGKIDDITVIVAYVVS